ncbi:ClpP/crotonase-like domain-containing protein [Cytidiella melzeri]|nr:ClpP/crotonase-like domain-containing protein [Cytidiella melzeri]
MSFPAHFPANESLVTVTHPSASIWLLELHNGADNRLTDHFINKAVLPALDAVERDWRQIWRAANAKGDKEGAKGALIIVGNRNQHKFFSNGLDYDKSLKNPRFWPDVINPLFYRLLTYPIPTIAAVNGHCFAGGMVLALSCDYRVMTDGATRRAWMCMNEVHFGASWPASIACIIGDKVPDSQVRRKIGLEGHRFTGQEAVAAGFVDALAPGNTEDVIKKAQELGEVVGAQAAAGAWGLIRSEMYAKTVKALRSDEMPRMTIAIADAAAKARL